MNTINNDVFSALIEDFIFQYDITTSKIDFLKKQNILICEDVTLEEFTDSLFSLFNISDSYKSIFLAFLEDAFKVPTAFKKGTKLFNLDNDSITMDFSASIVTKRIAAKETIAIKFIGFIKTNVESFSQKEHAFDKLTGTYYVDDIYEIARQEIEIKQTQNVTLMIHEIRNIDNVTKKYGLDISERILCEVGDLLKRTYLLHGSTGRIGKNTFLSVIYGLSAKQEIWDMNRVFYINLEKLNNYSMFGIPSSVYLNTGISRFPFDGQDFETVFKKACKAIQRAYTKKLAAFVIYNEEMHSEFSGEIELYSKNISKLENYNEKELIATIVKNLYEKNSFETKINIVLKLLSDNFRFDRLNVVKLDYVNNVITPISQFINEKSEKTIPIINFDINCFNRVKKILNKNEIFICENIQDLIHTDYTLFKTLLEANSKSLIVNYNEFKPNTATAIIINTCDKTLDLSTKQANTLSLLLKIINNAVAQELEYSEYNRALYFDPVTNIYNGNKFINKAVSFIENNKTATHAIISIDFYHFKFINEKYGYEEGNRILQKFANILAENSKENSIYARFSADKFLVLYPNCTRNEVENYVKTLQSKIKNFTTRKNQSVTLAIFSGICIFNNPDTSLTVLIDNATLARTSLTLTNNSQYAFYEDKMLEEYLHQNDLEGNMLSALENDEFKVFLQPKFDIRTGIVCGAEALIRWHYNHTKLLSPATFVPLFEKNGFITTIDLFVLESACKLLKSWEDNNKQLIPISVNISRVHLENEAFYPKVVQLFEKYNTPTKYIEFEITESIFIEDVNALINTIEKFHKLGVSVSIDDFGSGYSNLNLLSNVNVDTIKLDKSLFRLDNTKDKIIIESIVNLASKLNVNTISEGIETIEQKQFLESIGCHFVQGYLYSKPIPILEFEEKYITKRKN